MAADDVQTATEDRSQHMASNDRPFDFDAEFRNRTAADEWQTSDDVPVNASELVNGDNGYTKRKVFLRSTDGHGHGSKINVKLLETQLAQIGEWVADKRTKYRSTADFIRDAVWHRLHDMPEVWNDEMSPELRAELFLAGLEVEEIDYRRREEVVQLAGKRLQREMDEGRWERVASIVAELEHVAEDWPTSLKQQAMAMVAKGREGLRRAVSGGE